MSDQRGLLQSNTERTREAHERAKQAVISMANAGRQINFSSVAKESGISRPFLYGDPEIREMIEAYRKRCIDNEINRRARYDKTAKSKDIIIAAKDKRIAKLEEENKRLRDEVSTLRGLIYGANKLTSITCKRHEECSDLGG